MNAWEIIEKGLKLLPSLIDAGVSVTNTVNQMINVAEKSKKGETVTKTELEALEADLDAALSEFNSPLPPET